MTGKPESILYLIILLKLLFHKLKFLMKFKWKSKLSWFFKNNPYKISR